MRLKSTQRRERAVAVAKDVLAQLAKPDNKMIPSHNGYIDSDFFLHEDDSDDPKDLQHYVPDILAAGCQVCALGAALISKAKLFDEVTVEYHQRIGGRLSFYDEIKIDLDSVFTPYQSDLIEAAFETSDIPGVRRTTRSVESAIYFGERYDCPQDRLVAIMTNIIANDGLFKP